MLLSVFEQVSAVPNGGTAMFAARIGGAAAKRRELLGAGAVPGVPGADIIAAYVLVNRSVAWGVGILLFIFTIVTVSRFSFVGLSAIVQSTPAETTSCLAR